MWLIEIYCLPCGTVTFAFIVRKSFVLDVLFDELAEPDTVLEAVVVGEDVAPTYMVIVFDGRIAAS